ncbi:MAG: acyltransferase family protein [Gemmatimonadetes bacterium]|nr:acyltransferase family protein [Gemmatimonadota bacterium]
MAAARWHGLDAVRGFALITWAWSHASMAFLPGPQLWLVADATRSTTLSVAFFTIHMARMTLFFVLAGFFGRVCVSGSDRRLPASARAASGCRWCWPGRSCSGVIDAVLKGVDAESIRHWGLTVATFPSPTSGSCSPAALVVHGRAPRAARSCCLTGRRACAPWPMARCAS